jgi:hypothetical protein
MAVIGTVVNGTALIVIVEIKSRAFIIVVTHISKVCDIYNWLSLAMAVCVIGISLIVNALVGIACIIVTALH